MLELVKIEERTEILKQQAAKTSKEYLKLLDEQQKDDRKSSSAELMKANETSKGSF